MTIISVCSEKGGVGKTTTTINVAGGLAKLGKSVLVIDLDQQGNSSQALGYIKDGKPTAAEVIYNAVAGIDTDYHSTIRHCSNGVDYVPASPMLTGITTFMASDSDSNYVLKRAFLNEAYNQYDYIILDCRTLLDLLVANAMNVSTHVIIPVESGVFSFEGLSKMLNKVKSINASTNRKLKVLGILLNKQLRTVVSTSIADSIREEYGNITFETAIPFCPAQTENAVLNGTSCVDEVGSTLGNAFQKVAEEIVAKTWLQPVPESSVQ